MLLEMGVRGGPNPHEQVPIGSLLGKRIEAAGVDLRDYEDLTPFDAAVLHPGRTLLEKLYLIHGLARRVAANSLDADRLRRHGRHFYDVYKLLGHSRVLALLADRIRAEEIMASIEAVTREEFAITDELRPVEGFAVSPVFDPDSDASRQMGHAYESIMPALYFGTDPLPAWRDICMRVQEHRKLL